MLLARGTIILEDANVVDAMPRFTSIANPPHGAVLLETIAASLNSARDAYLAPQGGSQFFNSCTLLKRFVKSPIRSRIHRVVISMAVTYSKGQIMVRSDYSTHEFVLRANERSAKDLRLVPSEPARSRRGQLPNRF